MSVFPLPHLEKPVAGLILGGDTLTEKLRLTHDPDRLLAYYPAIPLGELLFLPPDRWLPYQMVPIHHALVCEPEPYEVRGLLRPVRDQVAVALRAQPNYRDGTLTRLAQVEIPRSRKLNRITGPLKPPEESDIEKVTVLQPVQFTDVMATNLLADVPLARFGIESAEPSDTLRDSDRGNGGTLRPFEESMFANPIGVAGLGITADDQVIVMHRAAHLSTYADVLGPTSSGYVDWTDVEAAPDSFNEVLIHALRREIGEELLLAPTDLAQLSFTSFGVFREFYRAGFVQAFYGFTLPIGADAIYEQIASHGPHPEFQAMLTLPRSTDFGALALTGHIENRPIGLELQALFAAAKQAFWL
jgi:hypothetical protein